MGNDVEGLEIRAPGEVSLPPRLAGIGTRFLALLLDHLILITAYLLVFTVLFGLVSAVEEGEELNDLLIFVALGLHLLYFSLCESRQGRTPGKAAVGIRVLRADGSPPDLRDSILRNLTRILWLPPLPGLLAECLALLLLPKRRRLGDLLAGCVVVIEESPQLSRQLLLRYAYRERPHHDLAALERVKLTPEEYQALRVFCFRTRTLSKRRRIALGRELLGPLYERAELPRPEGLDQEDLLVDLLHLEGNSFGRHAPGIVEGVPAPGSLSDDRSDRNEAPSPPSAESR